MEHLPKLRRGTEMELYNVWGHGYGILRLRKCMNDFQTTPSARKKLRT